MPNEIYEHTYKRLAELVSARAASRALRNALESKAESAENINTKAMIRLIKGPIFREFQLILPRDGLKRNLNDLIGELRNLSKENIESDDAIPSTLSGAVTAPLISVTRATVGGVDKTKITLVDEDIVLDEVDPELDAGLDDLLMADYDDTSTMEDMLLIDDDTISDSQTYDTNDSDAADLFLIEDESRAVRPPDSSTALTIPPANTRRVQAGSGTGRLEQRTQANKVYEPLDENTLETMVLKFAQIEQVTQIAAMRQRGQVVVSRGDGINLEQLSRLGLMAIRLLERSGQLRSYYLSHSSGQIFLLPLGQDIVVVAGTPELNVGEIFSNHTALVKTLDTL